ncbi:hypothetical protein ACXZ1K_10585 [Pedobacter sp. PWIIR3]
MASKKKKEAAAKAALEIEKQHKALKQRFIGRITELLEHYGGKSATKIFPPAFIGEKLFQLRYAVLKGKASPDYPIAKEKVVQFNSLLNYFMQDEFVALDNGNKYPLSWYPSEGLTLIYTIDNLDPDIPEAIKVLPHFKQYLPKTKHYEDIQLRFEDILLDATRYLSDLNTEIIKVDTTHSAVFVDYEPKNDLFVRAFKPETVTLLINGEKHSAIQLGWVNPYMKWHMLKVKPSQLGFKVGSLDIPLDIFVQKHALMRLKERINITPGVMHEILFLTFAEDKIIHVFKNGQSLVEYRISDEKAGYFLVKLHGNQLVIHTFLFLTNDRTPEGDKLKKLLAVEKTDKKYLEIDNLPAFNAYRIYENEALSKLFTEAGCGSLLKLGHLKAYSQIDVNDKDSESIERYLADAPYFRNMTKQT